MAEANRIPCDIELERAVLGAVLLSDRSLKVLVVDEHLQPETFHRESHAEVLSAMLAVAGRGAGIDVHTTAAEMQRRGNTDSDLAARLDGMVASVVDAGNVREHARRLVELAELRTIGRAAYDMLAGVEVEDRERIAAAEQLLADRGRGESAVRTGEQRRDDLWAFFQNDETADAFPFPWPELNEAMGGMARQDTTFVGAWTNFGKSPLVDQILDHVATTTGAHCALYANEGNRHKRDLRNLARDADVNLTRLERKRLRPDEHDRVAERLGRPLSFDYVNCAQWPADTIARHLRWHRPDVAAVDLLHNIAYRDAGELDRNILTLTQAAVVADCHLLLVGHFNEERAKSEELPKPVLRDIRGSGMVKNACANVLFLHRDQATDDDGLVKLEQGSLVYFQKVRYGELGGVRLNFTGSRQRFDPDTTPTFARAA